MLKFINTIIGLIVLSTLAQSQEVVCQNGRCDIVRKAASVAVVPVIAVSNIIRNEPQIVLHRASEPQMKIACRFPRLRKIFR